ncbi:MAG: response regulator, partial [Deltaproteobacteria bacterium]|nr:response regulator [Deltaproteobacteria bacterium]
GLSKIPAIVLVTAYGREDVMQQAEQLGLEGFLLKPVSPSLLFDTTMQAFGKDMPRESHAALERGEASKALERIRGAEVLLVEDNEINQQVAKEILQGAGLKVSLANDGQEAVKAVQEHRYDAVLMDVQMPIMDGYAATQAIRRDPQFDDLPIIAMTAHAMAGDKEKSRDAGMNDHVTKPIDPDQLFATLSNWIKRGKDREAAAAQGVDISTVPGADLSSEPASPEEGKPDGAFPESLPGFDLAAGLKRLGGNHGLYRKLLLNFAGDYSDSVNDIRKALTEKEIDRAHALIHTLKGVAGNLAATDLQAAVTGAEKLLKEADSDQRIPVDKLDAGIAAMEDALNQALASVQTLGSPPSDQAAKPPEDEASPKTPALSPDTVARIRDAVEVGDVTELTNIAEELKSESDSLTPFCDRIIQLAGDFDFDGIMTMVNGLEGSHA